MLARQMGLLDVEVEVELPTDAVEFFVRIEQGNYDLSLSGWIADTPDPVDFLEATLSTSLIPEPGKSLANTANEARWRDREIDANFEIYRAENNEETKKRILRKLTAEVPLLPIMYGSTVIVHSWRVQGFQPPAFGMAYLARLRLNSDRRTFSSLGPPSECCGRSSAMSCQGAFCVTNMW